MGLEDMTGADKFIDVFVNTNPVGATDPKSQGDDHLRGIKNVLLNSFPNITGAITSTHTELNILDGATVTTAELNILDGVTADAAELNTMDGITASTAELNTMDGITASTVELNTMDGITASTAELNIMDGITGFIDDDSMATASATNFCSGESIKAYVDTNLAALPFTEEYTSPAQTPAAAATYQLAHGLSNVPYSIDMYVKCTDAGGEAGYAQNEEVLHPMQGLNAGSALTGYSVNPDGTNLNIVLSSAVSPLALFNKASGIIVSLTLSKWEVYFKARA
ncbi:MAG: hypothetical protein KAR40_07915 [Candidatus Sabulitectum sp.]|nr:hypothetical protein [Candidatus Sabulitectum sp.]